MRTLLLVFLFSALVHGEETIPLKNETQPTTSGSATETFKATADGPAAPSKGAKAKSGEGTPNQGAAQPYIATLDTYGSSRINEKSVRKLLGNDLDVWFQKGLTSDPTAVELEATLKDKVKKKWGFPFAEWSVVQYFQPGDMAIHVTLDVVEPSEVAKRMPFSAPPTQQLADPDLLIKSWQEYEDTALDLVENGQLEPDTAKCPAFHCPFGHQNPKLKKFEKIFVEGVKKDETQLAEIQAKDQRADFRAAASYLLAYLKDGNKVVGYEMGRVKDPDDLVRNNALRVLGDIAEYHPEYVIPVGPILQALHYPRVSDRSKALYVAFQLVGGSPQAREEVVKKAVPDLLQMMESKQPDHHDLSYGILKKVSGKDYAVTDLRSWRNWFAKLPDRAITKK